jgi:hypothetical protein
MAIDRKTGHASKKLNSVSSSILSLLVFLGRKIIPDKHTDIPRMPSDFPAIEKSASFPDTMEADEKVENNFPNKIDHQPTVIEDKQKQELEAPISPNSPLKTRSEPVKTTPQMSSKNEAPLAREHTRKILAEAGTMKETEENVSDVFLDIPTVKVDEIRLNVENLDAKVALHAQLANLVRIDVGAEVGISKVELDIKGVEAQALLKVRLKQVYAILARALETLDRNPELLHNLLQPIGETVRTLGREAGRAVGEIGTQTGHALGPGGAIGDTIRNVGETARETLGPEGAVSEVAKDVGKTVNETVAPEGAVGHTLGHVGEVAKGVTAPQGPVGEAIKGVSEGVDQTIEGRFKEDEEKRRYYREEGKRHTREPDIKEKKPA